MEETIAALDELTKAIQKFVSTREREIDEEGRPVYVRCAAVVWESVVYEEDGEVAHKISYATTPNTSMSETVGLLRMGESQVVDDLL